MRYIRFAFPLHSYHIESCHQKGKKSYICYSCIYDLKVTGHSKDYFLVGFPPSVQEALKFFFLIDRHFK